MDSRMDTVWSEEIQGILTLYLSRKLRFDDLFFSQYQPHFGIAPEAECRILEIGCGPGALAGALRRWFPRAKITAIDRDRNFIRFAREHEPGIEFLTADAAELPFGENTFDVTISYTVQEHVAPNDFWTEQRRVLKPGGVCLCLSARRGVHCVAPCLSATEAEKAFWEGVHDQALEQYGVGRYRASEAELPAAMEAYGFTGVTTGYAVIDLTPDHPKFSAQKAEAIFEADRQCDLEAIASAHSDHAEQAIAAVNAKYDERLRLFRSGVKQWDTSTSITMILRGTKKG